MIKAGKIFFLIALLALCLPLFAAGNAEEIYSEGRKLYLAGEYYDAAQKFEESFFMADSAVVRVPVWFFKVILAVMAGIILTEMGVIKAMGIL